MIGVLQVLSEVHDTVAVVAVPVSSTRPRGDVLVAPVALFQFVFPTTPAVSELPIPNGALPTKFMLTAPCPGEVLLTERVTGVVCVRLPLVPAIVSG